MSTSASGTKRVATLLTVLALFAIAMSASTPAQADQRLTNLEIRTDSGIVLIQIFDLTDLPQIGNFWFPTFGEATLASFQFSADKNLASVEDEETLRSADDKNGVILDDGAPF